MTDAAEQPAPRTAAGRRLFTDNDPMDMLESDGVTWDDILAIEAEAAAGQPPPDEAVLLVASAMAYQQTGERWPALGNDGKEWWTAEARSFLKESESASPPPTLRVSGTAAPPACTCETKNHWSGYHLRDCPVVAAPERVSGLDVERLRTAWRNVLTESMGPMPAEMWQRIEADGDVFLPKVAAEYQRLATPDSRVDEGGTSEPEAEDG